MWFGASAALGQSNDGATAERARAFVAAATPGESQSAPLVTEDPIPTKSLWGIIHSGGVLMIPLAACSMVLLAFIFERSISLRRGRVIPKPFVRRFLAQMHSGELDRQQAMTLCEENGSPVSEVFAGAVRKWGRPAVEVEQAIIDAGERVTNSLRRYLRVLNTVATISPLLGLLGTVVGMISAF
ncbi:MAG: MotA/TolQ/ExbB proton channel family protein, partial [Pirellulaceae bacterium]|nr:MotA/TolQ/ExbB proton channel family protein [Pirellulaceae bacterium]